MHQSYFPQCTVCCRNISKFYYKMVQSGVFDALWDWPGLSVLVKGPTSIQYIPRNMHTVFALLCFVVVIHCLIFPYPSGLLHWHCGNLTIAPVPAKQPWWIWINTSCEFIMNDCITTTKQSTTKPCAYFLGYTVCWHVFECFHIHSLMTIQNINEVANTFSNLQR